jgi:hypothetical protein
VYFDVLEIAESYILPYKLIPQLSPPDGILFLQMNKHLVLKLKVQTGGNCVYHPG